MASVQVSLVREFRTLNEKLDKLFSRNPGTKLTDYRIETIAETDASGNLNDVYMCSATYCGVYKFTGPLQLLKNGNTITDITSPVIADNVKLINGKLVYKDMTEFYISHVGTPENTSSFIAYFSCDSSITGQTVPQLVVSISKVVYSSDFEKYGWECYEYDTTTDTITTTAPTASAPTSDLLAVYITPSNPPNNSGIHFYVNDVPAKLRAPSSVITCYRFVKQP